MYKNTKLKLNFENFCLKKLQIVKIANCKNCKFLISLRGWRKCGFLTLEMNHISLLQT